MPRPYQYDVYVDGAQSWRVVEANAAEGWYVQYNSDNTLEKRWGKVEIRSYTKQGEFLGLVDYANAGKP